MRRTRWDVWSSRLASRLRWNAARAAAPRSAPPPSHCLTLFEYEASPWCRLVREQLTILDLRAQIRPCPRQTIFLEGALGADSRFRPQAMQLLQHAYETDDLTFPLLVDYTDIDASKTTRDRDNPLVVFQSYDILQHLWDTYGQSVLPSSSRRPDQMVNSTRIPFVLRFLSLSGPSYVRSWPTCGLMRTPSFWDDQHDGNQNQLVLYQAEGCPESRLVREILCTLELPYLSIPMGKASLNNTRAASLSEIPVLIDGDVTLEGAQECMEYLWKKYRDPNLKLPSWLDSPPTPNLGREGSFSVAAYSAFVRGSRDFVPSRAME